MAKGKLFEFAVLYHPRPTKDSQGNEVRPKSELIGEPKTVLAQSDKEVGILAARALDEKYIDKLEDVEIIVRPF